MTGSTNRINPTLSGPDFVSFQVRDIGDLGDVL